VANGYITALSITSSPTRYEPAAFKAGRRAPAASYFSVCGENDHEHLTRNLICVETSNPCRRFIGLSIGYEDGMRISLRADREHLGSHPLGSTCCQTEGCFSHGDVRS
jgi:hypothetical protein